MGHMKHMQKRQGHTFHRISLANIISCCQLSCWPIFNSLHPLFMYFILIPTKITSTESLVCTYKAASPLCPIVSFTPWKHAYPQPYYFSSNKCCNTALMGNNQNWRIRYLQKYGSKSIEIHWIETRTNPSLDYWNLQLIKFTFRFCLDLYSDFVNYYEI